MLSTITTDLLLPWEERSLNSTDRHGTMKLYSNPFSRGVTVEWYIREIGADVEIVKVDMYEAKEHKKPEYLKINPLGRVPAFQDGDLIMSETGAILLYLFEKCGGGDKLPLAQRGKVMQWVLFANSTLEESAFGPKRDEQLPALMSTLDQQLASHPYLLGEEFSVADVAVGAGLTWIPSMVPLADPAPYKNIVAYLDRLKARKACADTLMAALAATPASLAKPSA